MISPRERARVLDAEMQLQRAWLEISLRDFGGSRGIFSRLRPLNIGLSFLKHRSVWLAGISLLVNLYRRHVQKGHS